LLGDTIFYLAELTDLPVQKERSVKLNLNVLKVKNDTGYTTVKGAVIAYLQKNNVIKQPRIGQIYLIKSALHEVREPMNPHEFNFKNYLANKNIYHTTFIDSNSFKELYVNNAFSLQRFGLGIKQSIVEQLKESGLDRDAYTICSALITGFDDEIDKFEVNADWISDDDVIELTINYNSENKNKLLYDLSGELNEIIAHEIRHIDQETTGSYNTKGRKGQVGKKYYTQPHELDAQIFGFKRISKLTKTPFDIVVKRWFNTHSNLHQMNDTDVKYVIDKIMEFKKEKGL
jgi:hypothetical protein